MGCLRQFNLLLLLSSLGVLTQAEDKPEARHLSTDQDINILVPSLAKSLEFLQWKTTPRPERPPRPDRPSYHYPYYPQYPHYPAYPYPYPPPTTRRPPKHHPPHPPQGTHYHYYSHPPQYGHYPPSYYYPPHYYPRPPFVRPPIRPPPMIPGTPVGPIDSVGPKDPVDPVGPKDPVDPIDTVDPIVPIDPNDPIDPVDPVIPIDPEEPGLIRVSIPGIGNRRYFIPSEYDTHNPLYTEIYNDNIAAEHRNDEVPEFARSVSLDGLNISADSLEFDDSDTITTKDVKLPLDFFLGQKRHRKRVSDQVALIYLKNYKKGRQLKQ